MCVDRHHCVNKIFVDAEDADDYVDAEFGGDLDVDIGVGLDELGTVGSGCSGGGDCVVDIEVVG